jgi:hypothetical protein
MGRIDAIIPDELESKLRIEIVKRFGGKKGDLQKAIEEALEMWINRDTIGKLKAQATNSSLLSSEREEATKILANMGYCSIDALLEIGNDSRLLLSERTSAREQAKKLIAKKSG